MKNLIHSDPPTPSLLFSLCHNHCLEIAHNESEIATLILAVESSFIPLFLHISKGLIILKFIYNSLQS